MRARHGAEQDWDFVRKTQRNDKLKFLETSTVVDKINKETGRVRVKK
jgi:hypothetical protein